ncbi:peptidyl-prolyl cis-trans isomerase, cyclophilin-type protein [Rhizoctonia solani]|uniref:peptidylprolyl isomerase n=1 Tax=Rhizoctonia solani TaxID=456999 RepID=A0A8H8NPK9_9AGAM|nr:peptidyl-prolyl cis-trans isomerase, cyclophilin-type protein [Rhizoctonia solani]QRW16462.1 peptidyl-prolyl cis-trans isomerase, cyclophilin-type protein [Rhizoctonia solani]
MSTSSVTLQTNMGDVTFELYEQHAPKACKNFSELAKRGYYNGNIFHRIIADFMIQGGDPTGTGRGGTSIYGQKFEDEITPELRFTGAGILAMANSGPNTNGSQFFITLAPTPYLDGKHTIFGRLGAPFAPACTLALYTPPHRESSLSPAPTLSLGRASFPLTSPPQPQQHQETRERSLSSATEPPWKSRPRPKRQLSTSAPNPPAASPKRRRQNGKASVTTKDVTEKGNDSSRKGNEEKAEGESASGKGKQVAGARVKVGKIKLRVKEDPPAPIDPEIHDPNSGDEKLETLASTLSKTVSPAPWKSKISPPSGLVNTNKAKPAPRQLFEIDVIQPTESSAPLNTSKPALIAAKPARTAKRPVYTESNDSSQEQEEEKTKKHKRRKSHATETTTRKPKPKPKPSRKSRVSTPPRSSPHPDSTSGPLELRPASFLTKSSSFLTKPVIPSTTLNVQPREDVWSYDDLTGLTWIKLDIEKCQVVPGNQHPVTFGEQWCWWPAEVKQNTSNGLQLSLCGLGIERELTPNAAAESNILTFRKPNSSSVRFPTFKSAFSPPVVDVEVPNPDNEAFTQVSGGLSTPPTTELSSILPTSSPAALETSWKRALTCAFEIDTESNDGLEDIFLLFSQRSKSPQDDDNDEQSGNTALDDQSSEQSEDEDVLENGMTVLCRYRTRYYPAKIISYHPREGKSKKRADSRLGAYQRYTTTAYERPTGIREPSPAPRADSPAPEPKDAQIDSREYCSRERIRDQLKPVLPFLKGLIERRYIPGKGIVDGAELSKPETKDGSPSTEPGTLVAEPSDAGKELQPTLDRHAVFMQGGRARKNLAYSVYTGDLNEDDCEELMFELSRWALRGERWACGELENVDGGDQEGKEGKEEEGADSQDGSTQEAGASDVENNAELDGMGSEALQMQGTDNSSSTELEDEPLTVVKILEAAPSTRGDFRSLVKLQPPRPSGASDYEALTAEERMGYVSDVLYPEAAALIISYRRGIRTQPGPLTDQAAEHALYTTGQEAAKNTTSTSDWVEQILAVRQLRESNSKYQVEEQTQVLSGGTRSRPKYATSTFK